MLKAVFSTVSAVQSALVRRYGEDLRA
jgi:hypothetical protein